MDQKSYFGHYDPKFKIIGRSEWDADPAKKEVSLKHPVETVLMLDTGGQECFSKEECVSIVKSLQKEHMEVQQLDDIPWSFLIGGDGNVYEGRGFDVRPIKTKQNLPKKFDGKTLDIAYIGNFQEKSASFEMKRAFGCLIEFGIDQDYLVQLFTLRRFVKKISIKEYLSKFKDLPDDLSFQDIETETEAPKSEDPK